MPVIGEAVGVGPGGDEALVDVGTGDFQHAADIMEMLFGAAFLPETQFVDDDVLRRGDVNGFAGDFERAPAGHGPVLHGVVCGEVDICFEVLRDVNEIEMAVGRSAAFDLEDFDGRAVVVWFGEESRKPEQVSSGKNGGEIDVEGQAGDAIIHSGDGADDHAVDAGTLERKGKETD